LRVDDLHIRVNNILGPVVAVGKTKELECVVKFVYTGTTIPNPRSQRPFRINQLSRNGKRNKLLIKKILRDLKKDRFVLVIVERIFHLKFLKKMMMDSGYSIGLFYGKTSNRKKFLKRARERKFDVIFCQRSLMKQGINIPPADTIHLTVPMSNPYSCYQEISRIRTPWKGKKKPKIVDYVDDVGACYYAKESRLKVYEENGFKIIDSQPKKPEKKGSWGYGLD